MNGATKKLYENVYKNLPKAFEINRLPEDCTKSSFNEYMYDIGFKAMGGYFLTPSVMESDFVLNSAIYSDGFYFQEKIYAAGVVCHLEKGSYAIFAPAISNTDKHDYLVMTYLCSKNFIPSAQKIVQNTFEYICDTDGPRGIGLHA